MRTSAVASLLLLAACHGTDPGPTAWTSVAAGPSHTCALTATGAAWCWGSGVSGRLGDGSGADANAPVRVEGSHRFSRIAAGFNQTCALRDNGAAFCWGENGNGEIGDGTTTDRFIPTAVGGGLLFHAISSGEGLSCGLTASDSGLYCWGVDIGGGVNAPPRDHLRPARLAPGRFAAVSVGYEVACALRADGQALCWGYGTFGQLGDSAFTSADIPGPVDQLQSGPFRALATGHDHTCAVATDDRVWCWGRNHLGQLSAATPGGMAGVPVLAAGGAAADSVDAHSAGHTCIVRAGSATCWGSNGSGQLGDGGQPGGTTPRAVAGGAAFRQISTGFGHSCGVDTGGVPWCWGANTVGQLGTGYDSASSVPVRVAVP